MNRPPQKPRRPAARFSFAMGAFFGALAIALGAFTAHALKGILPADALATFETAVRYQMYHAVGLLINGLLLAAGRRSWENGLLWTGRCFVAGTVLFSGSLYALSTAGLPWIGFFTPLGGVTLIAGWCILLLTVIRHSSEEGV